MSTGFDLTPQEDLLWGVSLHGTTLRFTASGTQVIEAGLMLVAAVGAGVAAVITASGAPGTFNGYEVDHPLPVVVLFVIVACGFIAGAATALGSRVEATPEGLVVHDHWRRRTLGWEQVVDVQAVDTAHQRWRGFAGPGLAGFWMRPVAANSVGMAVTVDGMVVRLPSFRASARGEGLSMGGPTATEVKVAALRRFRTASFGPWPPSEHGLTVEQMAQSRSLLPSAALAFLAPIALWTVLELATAEAVGVGLLIVTWLAAAGIFLVAERRRLVAAFRRG